MNDQMKPNNYTNEFKASAVKLAIESDQSVSKTAEELGINKITLHTWISNRRGIFNGFNDFHGAATVRTVFNVDIEYPFE